MGTRLILPTRKIIAPRRMRVGLDYPTRWGLISRWGLHEASGPRADQYGQYPAHLLTDTNTVTAGAALAANLGPSSQFTSANSEQLTCADTAALSAGNLTFGIAAWVLLDSKPATVMGVAFKGTNSGVSNATEFRLDWLNTSDRFLFRLGDAANAAFTSATCNGLGAPALSTAYLLTGWFNHVSQTANIRGNITNANSLTTAGRVPPDTAGNFRIGCLGANYWNGRIGPVAFFKPPTAGLTGAQIDAIFDEISSFMYGAGAGRSWPWGLEAA